MTSEVTEQVAEIEVRFEEHPSGGSVWVRTQNPFDDIGSWLCIWSTSTGNRGERIPGGVPGFIQATTVAPGIVIPDQFLHALTTSQLPNGTRPDIG